MSTFQRNANICFFLQILLRLIQQQDRNEHGDCGLKQNFRVWTDLDGMLSTKDPAGMRLGVGNLLRQSQAGYKDVGEQFLEL